MHTLPHLRQIWAVMNCTLFYFNTASLSGLHWWSKGQRWVKQWVQGPMAGRLGQHGRRRKRAEYLPTLVSRLAITCKIDVLEGMISDFRLRATVYAPTKTVPASTRARYSDEANCNSRSSITLRNIYTYSCAFDWLRYLVWG